MSDNEKIMVDAFADVAWRPHALFARPTPVLSRPIRIAVVALLVALHGLALWGIARLDGRDDGLSEADSALLVTFITRPERRRDDEVEPDPAVPIRVRMPTPAPASTPHRALSPPRADAGVETTSIAAPASLRAELYGADGRLRLPQATLDALKAPDADTREFSYQVPGLDRADKLLRHTEVLEYRPTRFAKMYRPTQDLLTDLLLRAVEATTPEVRIPVPGNQRAHVVCRISLLALGGSCGIDVNGEDYIPPGDDPNTLSPEEDRECQAWWDKIVAADAQDAWRKTRALYDTQCRKPLERKPADPPPPRATSATADRK